MLDIEIRDATITDINKIMEIESLTFKAPWPKDDVIREITDNKLAVFMVLTINEEVVGFCDYWNTFESGTICQIAIHPKYQRQSLGSKLLEEIFKDAFAKKTKTLTLEVRETNTKAICFYKKHGFRIETIKRDYYSNGENAFYMIKEVY